MHRYLRGAVQRAQTPGEVKLAKLARAEARADWWRKNATKTLGITRHVLDRITLSEKLAAIRKAQVAKLKPRTKPGYDGYNTLVW